jgi:hypothetical protein
MTARIRRRFDPLFWPRFAMGLLRLSKKVRTDEHAGPAVCPAASGRIPAAGFSVPSGRTQGSASGVGYPPSGSAGAAHQNFPLHEDAE